MRRRPCLLFACIFLTGITFQRYGWKYLWLVLLYTLFTEIYHAIKSCMMKPCQSQILGNERIPGTHFGGRESYKGFKILRRMAGRSLVLLSAFFLGMSHMKSQEDFRNTYMSKLEDGRNAVVFGEILTINETEYGCRFILTDCYVSLNEETIPCNKVMVYASSDQYHIGQIYQVNGQLKLFEKARNEGNFDSVLFYQSQKIDFSIYESESILLGCNENVFKDKILALKEKMEKVYRESLKEDAAGFYMGMMLGDKSLLSEETKDLFAVGGISHMLAISGLHMSIIGRGFYKRLRKRRVGFLLAGVLAGLLLLSYCYMVGSGTSAIRAVGMMLLFFLSQYIGRSYDMLNSLGAVVIYLLWENPFLIEYSGFQFSIAALIGVGFVGQTLSSSNEKTLVKNLWNSWASRLWMSIGITLTTLPIVACCYYEVPMYSPFVNGIVLPMLNPIFALALFGALIGCVIPTIGNIILIPCGWLFAFYEFVCTFVEGLPFGSVITGIPKMEVIVAYYVVLFTGIMILKSLKNRSAEKGEASPNETKELVLKLIVSIICFFLILYPKTLKSEIVFLDVGQGDGIYIGSKDGTTCFIDGGSSDVNQVGTYRILPFLKAHGVKRMDYWFVSHADTDHMSGVLEVMEDGYEIGHLVISDKMPEDESKERLLVIAKENEINVLQIAEGDTIQSIFSQPSGILLQLSNMWSQLNGIFSDEGIRITCLYPWADAGDRNEQSMVLMVEFFDENQRTNYKALFSGDISIKGEAELIRKGVLEDVDLYKAAHHGSKYSNSLKLLEVIQPEICVISCGKDNVYGHPHAEVIENLENAGVEIAYTMESGQVTINILSKKK